MEELIIGCIFFGLAIFALVLSIRSFCGKGFLLNNAYLYASPKEREAMEKRPYYRQSAVVFLLLCLFFALNGLDLILQTGWLSHIATALIVITILYAIVSSVLLEKGKK